MTCAMKNGFCFSGYVEIKSKTKGSSGFCQNSFCFFNLQNTKSKNVNISSSDFMGKSLNFSDHMDVKNLSRKPSAISSLHVQESICISKARRWWEKTLIPNMLEINSTQQLVDSLLNAGDKLVIVDFYSPGCGGCKALHPKICQLAELNPNLMFLKVNYEELKTMCYSINIHVLPFFRFYRGAEGRVCSFSCTNATIKKFKEALAKHGVDRCSLGPAKGLDESELLKLASNGEISLDLPLHNMRNGLMGDLLMKSNELHGSSSFRI